MRKIILDFETTGLVPPEAKIIQLAYTEIDNEVNVISKGNYLIDPQCPMSAGATRAHGKTAEDMKGYPTEEWMWSLPILQMFYEPYILIAHNAKFDRKFVPDHEEIVPFCTMELVKRVFDLKNDKLETVNSSLNLVDSQMRMHDAEVDVLVIERLLRYIHKNMGLTVEGMMDVSEQEICYGDTYKFGKFDGIKMVDVNTENPWYTKWILGPKYDDERVKKAVRKFVYGIN